MGLPYDKDEMIKVLVRRDIEALNDDSLYDIFLDGHKGYNQMTYDEIKQQYEDHMSNQPDPDITDEHLVALHSLRRSLADDSHSANEVDEAIKARELELK